MREREARTLPLATHTGGDAKHARGPLGRGYCGRRATTVHPWEQATCSDCLAARRADLEADGATR